MLAPIRSSSRAFENSFIKCKLHEAFRESSCTGLIVSSKARWAWMFAGIIYTFLVIYEMSSVKNICNTAIHIPGELISFLSCINTLQEGFSIAMFPQIAFMLTTAFFKIQQVLDNLIEK